MSSSWIVWQGRISCLPKQKKRKNVPCVCHVTARQRWKTRPAAVVRVYNVKVTVSMSSAVSAMSHVTDDRRLSQIWYQLTPGTKGVTDYEFLVTKSLIIPWNVQIIQRFFCFSKCGMFETDLLLLIMNLLAAAVDNPTDMPVGTFPAG